MAITRILGFDDGRTIEQLAVSTYSSTYNYIDGAGRTGSCLRCRYYGHADIPAGVSGNRVTLGFWFITNYYYSSSSYRAPLFILDASGNILLQLYFSSGTLQLYRGALTELLGEWSAQLFPTNTWLFLEIDAVIDPAAGSVVIRVDDTPVISVSGVNTGSANPATIRFGGNSTSSSSYYNKFDDVYIADDGVFLGPVSVRTVQPTAAGANSGLTGSDGDSVDNHSLVNDNNDATYVESATAADKDTYGFADLTGVTGAVKVVQVNGRVQKTEAAAISGRFLTRVGGVDYGGSDETLDVALKSEHHVWEQNPATAAPWTVSEVDAAEFGWEVRP